MIDFMNLVKKRDIHERVRILKNRPFIMRTLTGVIGTFALLLASRAQTIPPGVPEPGLVIWGTVVNQTNASQMITINSASWAVSDGVKSAIFGAGSTPA